MAAPMFLLWIAISMPCPLIVGAASAAGLCDAAAPCQHPDSGKNDGMSMLQTKMAQGAADAAAVGALEDGYLPVPQAEVRQEGWRSQHLGIREEDRAALQAARDQEEKLRRLEERLERRGQSPEARDEAELDASALLEQLGGLQGQRQEEKRGLQQRDEGLGLVQQDMRVDQPGMELAGGGAPHAGALAAPPEGMELARGLLGGLDGVQQRQQQQQDQDLFPLAPAQAQLPRQGPFPLGDPGLLHTADATQDCAPQCRWDCDDPVCDEICKPVCAPPKCETRCGTPDLSACSMDCNKAQCVVVCPKAKCPKAICAHCSTTCSEPICKLRCPEKQPCRNLCEEPACEWSCSAPKDCPAPKCSMVCEHPKNCLGTTHKVLPALLPGEVSVGDFSAENKTATMSLLGEDGQLQSNVAPFSGALWTSERARALAGVGAVTAQTALAAFLRE